MSMDWGLAIGCVLLALGFIGLGKYLTRGDK